MPGLYINDQRGILLKGALTLLPEKYRLSHVPFRVNTRKGPYTDVVYGTVTFRGISFIGYDSMDIVTIDLEVYVFPAYSNPPWYEWGKEELVETEFTPKACRITTRKSSAYHRDMREIDESYKEIAAKYGAK